MSYYVVFCCFFFNDTATTEIYTLSLHDALPIHSGRLADRFSEYNFCGGGQTGVSELVAKAADEAIYRLNGLRRSRRAGQRDRAGLATSAVRKRAQLVKRGCPVLHYRSRRSPRLAPPHHPGAGQFNG